MSEHDYWQVESSVYGGVGYAPATLEEYAAIAKALDDEAAGFAAIATAWESAALQLQSHRHSAPMCVTLQSGDPSAVVPGHVTAPYAALGNRCYDHATACQRLSDDLRGAADLLIRAHSLYSQAEMTARRMFTELLQAGTQAKPGYAAAGVAAVAAGGFRSPAGALAMAGAAPWAQAADEAPNAMMTRVSNEVLELIKGDAALQGGDDEIRSQQDGDSLRKQKPVTLHTKGERGVAGKGAKRKAKRSFLPEDR